MAKRLFWPTSGVIETLDEKLKWKWQWKKFVEFQKIGIQDQRNVHDEGELQSVWIIEMRDLHLKEVRSVVHERDHVPFLCH